MKEKKTRTKEEREKNAYTRQSPLCFAAVEHIKKRTSTWGYLYAIQKAMMR